MSASFAFYIHHHGSGHLMRALAIASHLKNARVSFLGSDLEKYESIIPKDIHCIHLPGDVAGQDDIFATRRELSFLHYVPMNVEKVARRAASITASLHALFPSIFIVDVSAEVTLLATLAGIPTVVIRQNGDRTDSAHAQAYESAQLLIAPSPELLMNPSPYYWVNEKTFFSGGFSKYSGKEMQENDFPLRGIGVMVGSGGTSLNGKVVSALAAQCPDRLIHVIGAMPESEQKVAPNVVFHGQLDDPLPFLSQCNVIIGNAGHNTVMEMADLQKKFICIPEERPFQEQTRKAELLEEHGMAVVIRPENLDNADWNGLILQAESLPENSWDGVINPFALNEIAAQLHQLWEHNFPKALL